MAFEARVKPEHRRRYPDLIPERWYPVAPLWPGLTQRTHNMSKERLTRIQTARDFIMIRAEHLEFRERVSGEAEAAG
jgi:hypothetical protein